MSKCYLPKHTDNPAEKLLHLTVGGWIAQAIYVVAKLGVADQLKSGPKTAQSIAENLGVDTRSLYRIMRALTSIGIFHEQERLFSLTDVGTALRSDIDGSLRHWAIMQGDEWQFKPWHEISYSVETGLPAFDRVFKQNVFDYVHQNDLTDSHIAMQNIALFTARGLSRSYDFSNISIVADIGGGIGTVIGELLKQHSHLRGILFDKPAVIQQQGEVNYISNLGVEDRCELIGGDFFESVPRNADIYLLCQIIHDWDDERSVAILRRCREAMGPKSRLIIVDAVIPTNNDFHFGKILDLAMLVITPGGRERTQAELSELLDNAGLTFSRMVDLPSHMSVVEAIRPP